MVMFVLRQDDTVFINFNIEKETFKIGEIIEHEKLEGKHKVVHVDPATVTVKPV
ncbi:hypothetical protein [Bacillus phage vB_BanS-Thrax1]|nr:hypothetical protein [Bacillus phage vB_BanS-Thrax1]